jgi:hypothetical protein
VPDFDSDVARLVRRGSRRQAGGTEATLGEDLRLSVYVSIIERAAFMLKAQDELRLTLEQINEKVDASIRKSIEKMRMT